VEFGQQCGIWAASTPHVNQSSTVPIHTKHNNPSHACSCLFHPTKSEHAKVRVFLVWFGIVDVLWIVLMPFPM
jgi:hypothetical protein